MKKIFFSQSTVTGANLSEDILTDTPVNHFFFFKFIYFEKDRQSVSEGGAERGRERIPSRLSAVRVELTQGSVS